MFALTLIWHARRALELPGAIRSNSSFSSSLAGSSRPLNSSDTSIAQVPQIPVRHPNKSGELSTERCSERFEPASSSTDLNELSWKLTTNFSDINPLAEIALELQSRFGTSDYR